MGTIFADLLVGKYTLELPLENFISAQFLKRKVKEDHYVN